MICNFIIKDSNNKDNIITSIRSVREQVYITGDCNVY